MICTSQTWKEYNRFLSRILAEFLELTVQGSMTASKNLLLTIAKPHWLRASINTTLIFSAVLIGFYVDGINVLICVDNPGAITACS